MEHIFLGFKPESRRYTSTNRFPGDTPNYNRDRVAHARQLKGDFNRAWQEIKEDKDAQLAAQLPVKDGIYIEFVGEPGLALNIKSLENRQQRIRLLNVRRHKVDDDKELMKATVFVPKGKEQFFLNRIHEYGNETTEKGNPKHQALIETISSIKRAMLESFWIGDTRYIPVEKPVWCELWLRNDVEDIDVEEITRNQLDDMLIKSREESIVFPEITILLIKATYSDLVELLKRNEYITEIRKATEINEFFTELEHKDQIDFAKDLIERIETTDSNVMISLLDSGLNNGNVILNRVVKDSNIRSYFEDSGNDSKGHGSRMAGVALFGDLKKALESDESYKLTHELESMKILPDGRDNEPELYGYITSNSASTLYIDDDNHERQRVFCLAISTDSDFTDGRPTSWSASIDNITSGSIDEIKKLFLISAGNIRELDKMAHYPDNNLIETIEDPGQSWNAITVGAYTNLDKYENDNYHLVASKGQLSPFSRTSILYDRRWPIKPEIVLEGGNALSDSFGAYEDENLSLLTTHFDPTTAVFSHINATSAATALASRMAAIIQAEYPQAWPETVRALLIHSADWTDEMKDQFLEGTQKGSYQKLLRTCGYGVPNLKKALETIDNRVNLIIQSEIQPFDRIDGQYKTNEMHVHELPWPREVLQEMFNTKVKMKVTLSYFIEPGPGEKGWQDKYRYASAALRFELNGTNSKDEFIQRINAAAREDDYESIESGTDWVLGPNNRNVGSIHSDTWVGNAVDLATSNYIGIYPVIGWWRERPHLEKWKKKIRYSLIISLSTDKTNIDLLTPIEQEIEARISTPVETKIDF